jgi:hypothetical protein
MKVKEMKTKPILDEPPKSNSIAEIDKEVVRRLEKPIAKSAISTICLTSLLQAVTSPKPILDKKQSKKKLELGRNPNFPQMIKDTDRCCLGVSKPS